MAKVIHSMIRVFDLDRSICFYRDAFELEVAQRLDFDDFSLVYLRNAENDFEIELTWNRDQAVPYEHASGYGHLAVCVDDLDAEHRRFGDLGFEPRDRAEIKHEEKPLARFFFVEDPDGYKIEVIQRAGRYQ